MPVWGMCTSLEHLSSDCSMFSHRKKPQERLSFPPIPPGDRGADPGPWDLKDIKPQPCPSSGGWDPGALPGLSQSDHNVQDGQAAH